MYLFHLRIPKIEEIWPNQIFLESVGHTQPENMSQWPIFNYGKKSGAKYGDITYTITDNGYVSIPLTYPQD